MKEIKLENIVLTLSDESGNIRVLSKYNNVILNNQSIENVSELIKYNFDIVNEHYKFMIRDVSIKFNITDVNALSLKIVLHYLYMYNSWKTMYKKQGNRDLKFDNKDLNNTSTHDLIFEYYKNSYPEDWEEKCSILLGIGLEELKAYYKNRQSFYWK